MDAVHWKYTHSVQPRKKVGRSVDSEHKVTNEHTLTNNLVINTIILLYYRTYLVSRNNMYKKRDSELFIEYT